MLFFKKFGTRRGGYEKKLITTQHWLTQKLGLGSTIKVRVRIYHELRQRFKWKRGNGTLMKVIQGKLLRESEDPEAQPKWTQNGVKQTQVFPSCFGTLQNSISKCSEKCIEIDTQRMVAKVLAFGAFAHGSLWCKSPPINQWNGINQPVQRLRVASGCFHKHILSELKILPRTEY